MSEPLTEAELVAFKELADNATPGPWETIGSSVVPPEEFRGRLVAGEWIEWESGGYSNLENDQQFIAAAREAVPRLIAEVRRLQAVVQANQEGSPTP